MACSWKNAPIVKPCATAHTTSIAGLWMSRMMTTPTADNTICTAKRGRTEYLDARNPHTNRDVTEKRPNMKTPKAAVAASKPISRK